eukprot:4688701-Amphidinium_carterae.1
MQSRPVHSGFDARCSSILFCQHLVRKVYILPYPNPDLTSEGSIKLPTRSLARTKQGHGQFSVIDAYTSKTSNAAVEHVHRIKTHLQPFVVELNKREETFKAHKTCDKPDVASICL